MSWLSFLAGLACGVCFGGAIMACCAAAGNADRVSEDVVRRIELEEVD